MRSSGASAQMIRAEDELILCCARTRLDAERAERIQALLREEIDWTYLVTTAIQHGMGSLLYWHLRNHSPQSIPHFWMTFLGDHLQETAARGLYLTGELFKILELFEANGVRAIPYKGSILSTMAYGNLALRWFLDLDIITQQRDVRQAHELLVTQGFRLDFDLAAAQQASAERIPGEYLFLRDQDRSIVELHTERTMRFFPVPFDLERLAKRLQPVSLCGREVLTFSLEDSIWILCVHGSKHFWDRLLWISDIAELAQHPQGVNWERAEEEAHRLGCERMFFLGLYLASDVLGARLPEEVLRRAQTSPTVRSLAAGVRRKLFRRSRSIPGIPQRFFFRLRMRENLWDGARYCLRLATTPTEEDWSPARLPGLLTPLYSVLRPVRLLRRYGLGLAPRTEPYLGSFVPTPLDVVERMLMLGEVGPGDVVYDLGCGDGRIVVTAAKRFGIRGVGIDVNPRRIAEAKANAQRQGVQHLVRFVRGDANTADISEATVVMLYLTLLGNMKLRRRLREQLPPGARIVSRDFPMGDWQPEKTEAMRNSSGEDTTLYLWRVGHPTEHSSGEVPSCTTA